ncbi:MAG TPA: hypothetical protein VF230_03335 [Acidimicrobiales bacterium]
MGRVDGTSALVLAHDADHAIAIARREFPDRLPPDAAFLAAAATAAAVFAGERPPGAARVPVLS